MRKKNRNIIIAVAVTIFLVFLMFYASYKSDLVLQLSGPTEGTEDVLTAGNKLCAVSNGNHIFAWQWNDLSIWPVVAKPQANIITPIAGDKIVYNPVGSGELIIINLKADKKIGSLPLPYNSECKKIKTSDNGKFGAVSVLFKEGMQKGRFELAIFDSELRNLSSAFQEDTDAEGLLVYDFDITNDGSLLAGAGEKGRAWIFVTAVKSEKILWKKIFSEYGRFTLAEFSPDGKMLFAAEKVRYIFAFDTATGQLVKQFVMDEYPTPAHQKQNICCIAVSPDGKTLAADTEPAGAVWFWDIASGKEIDRISASALTVSGIAFSPDSKYLATSCMVSPEIKIWKVPQLKP